LSLFVVLCVIVFVLPRSTRHAQHAESAPLQHAPVAAAPTGEHDESARADYVPDASRKELPGSVRQPSEPSSIEVATQAARFLHVEVHSAPSGMTLSGAEICASRDDGSLAPPDFGPTHVISDEHGRALMCWPVGTYLYVGAEGHTPLVRESETSEEFGLGSLHLTREAAAVAAPVVVDLSALGTLHGRLDPHWAAGGRIYVGVSTPSTVKSRPFRCGITPEDRAGAVVVSPVGEWRVENLPTAMTPRTERAFGIPFRRTLVVRFEGVHRAGVPRVEQAYLGGQIELAPGEDWNVPDPFGPSAPVALTSRGPAGGEEVDMPVNLELLQLPDGEPTGQRALNRAWKSPSLLGRTDGIVALLATGSIDSERRVLTPDLPLGPYELRTEPVYIVESRDTELDHREATDFLGRKQHPHQAWGRFQHHGRPEEVELTRGLPRDGE